MNSYMLAATYMDRLSK